LKDNDFESFKEEKMSKPETIKMVGVSEPTFNRLVNAGRIKEYTMGKKKYYLRSEILQALRTQSEAGKVAPYKPREKPTIRSKKATAKV
jgi:predicted DNA-binding transcriptional regulator AlpA